MLETKQDYITYKDLEELLKYIFPDIDDWVHNKTIPNLIINGEKVKLRPTYRSEKLKLIILYNYLLDIPYYFDITMYIMNFEKKTYLYQKAGYRVVEISSHMSLTKIKEEFNKHKYTYIKNNKTEKTFINSQKVNKLDNETIHKGNIVKVLDMDFNEEIEYTLVETFEIDLAENKISIESPIGKALLGKRINQVVEVNIPDGVIRLKILKII